MPSPSPSPVFLNPSAKSWRYTPPSPTGNHPPPTDTETKTETPVQTFHRLLPNHAPTPLHSLPAVATALNLAHVLLKDESHRAGLPSFKILGASWAVYRAVAAALGIDAISNLLSPSKPPQKNGPPFDPLTSLGAAARAAGRRLTLVTCTEGNWGRAVARMAAYVGVAVVVYVPAHVPEATRGLIRGEGAEVRVVEGDYDDAAGAARRAAGEGGGEGGGDGAVLVMDIGWEGFEVVPQWVVEGYQTMLDESDAQVLRMTGGRPATHAVVPVGCGSVAQAVAQHFKSATRERGVDSPAAAVLAVELDTAACLRASLENGTMVSVPTGDSIMCGMNCGTLSTTAWPILKLGIDGTVVVSDVEAHNAVQELEVHGFKAGPCGSSTLAALEKSCKTERVNLGLSEESIVVLYCTEGHREYITPV
ncbi:tryptophan synthase beta subunit-like PLP-dependent enzyme [Chaetomium fimeti]|uniref:Tryptophan synthase beta subunit-like PLP-dependent enzyme n=1 Tax=Chaetomium fimeti TaxID=1854472 RepID=A0AAE0HQ24_9PEZI|nr:tryptophan synthase beta subunit-like PLP-dependent enzyme [Chaetomium fimeti]